MQYVPRYRSWAAILTAFMVAGLALTSRGQARHYLSDLSLAEELLPPPPLPGSPEQAADLAEVTAISRARTDSDTALAQSERVFFIFSFTPAIGSFFQSNNLPQTVALFRRVQAETDRITSVAKTNWNRPRPYEVDTNLFSGVPDAPHTSYPSSHATRGMVYSLLLAEIFPEQREAILGIGRQLGWHRVQLAMHYPTDVYAGRVLGQAIVRELKESPEFRRDFRRVKREVGALLNNSN